MNVTDLTDHWLAVDLTHVTASIFRLNATNVKVPGALVVVGNAETADSSHNLTVNCQNHLTI